MRLKQLLDEIFKRLEKIRDDSLIVFHYDIDGVASASAIWRLLKKKMIHAKFEPITNGWEKIVVEKIKKHNPRQIVFLDYAPNKELSKEIEHYEVIIIDHHEVQEIPKSFDYFTSAKIEEGYAISYLIVKTIEKFYGIKCDWLGFVGSYWDHCLEKTEWGVGYKKLINKMLPFDIVVSFTRIKGSMEMLRIFNESNSVDEALKKTKELTVYKKAKEIFEEEIKSFKMKSIGGVSIIYLKTKFRHIRVIVDYFTYSNPNKTFVFILKERKQTKFSFRSNRDVLKIAEMVKKEIPNFRIGGHKRACGGLLKDENEEVVIKKFLEYFKSHE